MYEFIEYEVKNQIGYVTINHPKANALNSTVLRELYEVTQEINADENVRVAIVTGAGRMFVAGADITEMANFDPNEGRDFMAAGHKTMKAIEDSPKPFIAAVNGYALGGGCELSMACDIRIASEKAIFGQPEVSLGIIPGFGGTQRLARLVGKGMAKYMILTNAKVGAEEALQVGLVQKVVPAEELMAEAEKTANMIIANAPLAITSAKKAIDVGYDLDIRNGCEYEIACTAHGFATEDQKEGMAAFLEKRKPVWKNK